MNWLMSLFKMLFSVFVDKAVEEIKKPDEAHFIGGDEELVKDVSDDITNQLIGDDDTKIMDTKGWKTLDEKLAELPPERRARIEKMAEEELEKIRAEDKDQLHG